MDTCFKRLLICNIAQAFARWITANLLSDVQLGLEYELLYTSEKYYIIHIIIKKKNGNLSVQSVEWKVMMWEDWIQADEGEMKVQLLT